MEKMMWAKPELNEVVFAANEYCSSCGPTGYKRYHFVCDAPSGVIMYYDHNNNNQLIDRNAWYTPCGKTHDVDVKIGDSLPFFDGFVDRDYDNKEDDGEAATIWIETWTEKEKDYFDYDNWEWVYKDVVKTNGHATDILNINDIEVAKS